MFLDMNKINKVMNHLKEERDARERAIGLQPTSEVIEILTGIVKEEIAKDAFVEEEDDLVGNIVQLFSAGTLSESKAKRVLNGLLTEDFISLFGNEAVETEEQLVEILESIDTGVEDNLIQLKMIVDGCTREVAITRLAVELNLQPEGDTWFKTQMEIVENNMQVLENLDAIAEKYPRLYSKLYSGGQYTVAFKCLEFLMGEFKKQLEYKGVFLTSCENTLMSSSFQNVSEETGCKYGTARNNITTLDKIGLLHKATDEEVKKISLSYFISVRKCKVAKFHSNMTTYLLVEWTEEVLESANDFLAGTRMNKTSQKATTYQSLKARGNETTLSKKIDKKMSKKDKEAMNKLKKWARQRINEEKSAHFFTKKDFESRFNNEGKKGTIKAGKVKQAEYLSILVAELDLVAIQPTKANRALLEPYLSSKVNNVDHRKDIFISRELFEMVNFNKEDMSLVK